MYFGSVRFFKNLILLAIIILIAIPTVFAIRLSVSLSAQEEAAARSRQELSASQAQTADARAQIADTQARLEDAQRRLKVLEEEKAAAEEAAAAYSPEMIYYQGLYPDFYAPQEYQATERIPGTIYLTFDDGPSSNTYDILDILDEYNVQATFFVLGQDSDVGLQRMKEIVDRGHTVGMHSWSHRYADIYDSVESFLDDMYQVFVQIRDATGTAPTFYRCPGGSINGYNGGIYQEILAEMSRRGFVSCDWNMSAEDAVTGTLDPDEIVANVLSTAAKVSSGYVLMHDSNRMESTVEALPDVIEVLRDMGFQFSRLTPEIKPVLFAYKN